MNNMQNIGSLIEYSGIGITVFLLILTNPELWKGDEHKLPRWFVFVPVPFFVGLSFLLFSCFYQSGLDYRFMGWLYIFSGTLLLFATYILYLVAHVAPDVILRMIRKISNILIKCGLSLNDAANKLGGFSDDEK